MSVAESKPNRPVARSTAPHSDRLLVFARCPEAGRTKTRLIAALGPERAAQLQVAMTRKTLEVARRFGSEWAGSIEVHFSGGNVPRMHDLFGSDLPYVKQAGESFGQRLEHAVAEAFAAGAQRVVVIGTDCPELEPAVLEQAFAALLRSDVVLGPALDGGYYLIGMKALHADLFRGIDWGSEKVLVQTLEAARRLRLRVQRLNPLSDVDCPEDLLACRRVGGACSAVLPTVEPGLLSVVVPTLQEEHALRRTLEPLVGRSDVEVIVADGGSSDATTSIARGLGARVLPVRPGRGRQMNAGAALARGEALLFLHADSWLPNDFAEQAWSILNDGAAAGAFTLRIRGAQRGLRWIEWGANLRSKRLQMPYGDQGLFVRAELFHRLGGFPNWPLMEDYELCRRLRRHGPIRLSPAEVASSARRWEKLGPWRTTWINQCCVAGFHLGVSPERLARWYSSFRS